MKTIILNNYYPHLTERVMLEVSDEIAVTLSIGGRLCDSYKRRIHYIYLFHLRGFPFGKDPSFGIGSYYGWAAGEDDRRSGRWPWLGRLGR